MSLTFPTSTITVQSSQTSAVLGPSTASPGDTRVIRLGISASRSFGATPPGWEKIQDQVVAGARRIGMFTRTVQAGDVDQTITFDGSTGLSRSALTIRGRSTAQTLVPVTAGSSTGASALVAPDTYGDAAGVLITWHDVTLTSGANTATMTDPASPWARLAYSASDGTAGYNTVVGSEARTPGATGTRTATSSGSGPWTATSLFVIAAPTGAAASARNINPNPSLKTSKSGWYGPPGWDRVAYGDPTLPRPGVFTGSTPGDVATPRFAAKPGKWYRGRVWGRTIAASNFDVNINWYTNSGAYLDFAAGMSYARPANDTSQYGTGARQAPAGAAQGLVNLVGVDGQAQFTAVLVREFDTEAEANAADMSFFDGDSDRARWDVGTDGTSTLDLDNTAKFAITAPAPVLRVVGAVRTTSMAIALDVPPPVLSVGLIAQISYDDNRGRIRLNVSGLTPGVIRAVISTRRQGTTKWEEIRGGRVPIRDGAFVRTVDHYEFAAGAVNEYRIIGLTTPENVPDVIAQSRVLTVEAPLLGPWIKFIPAPARNRKITLSKLGKAQRAARNVVYGVAGRTDPVVVTDVHQAKTTSIQVLTETLEEGESLDEALADGQLAFLHMPAGSQLPSMHVAIGDYEWDFLSPLSHDRLWTIPFTQVSAPPLSIVGAGTTYQTLLDRFASYDDLIAEHQTYREVLD